MQRMSHSRDQWQLNAHGLDSLNYVTTRSNGQESLQSRTRSLTHVDLEKVFLKMFFFWRKFNWYFFLTKPPFLFFCSTYLPLSKKSSKESWKKKQYFLKRDLLKKRLLAGKTQKRCKHQKNRTEKAGKKKNTTSAK